MDLPTSLQARYKPGYSYPCVSRATWVCFRQKAGRHRSVLRLKVRPDWPHRFLFFLGLARACGSGHLAACPLQRSQCIYSLAACRNISTRTLIVATVTALGMLGKRGQLRNQPIQLQMGSRPGRGLGGVGFEKEISCRVSFATSRFTIGRF